VLAVCRLHCGRNRPPLIPALQPDYQNTGALRFAPVLESIPSTREQGGIE
jgi:hypothetical protein